MAEYCFVTLCFMLGGKVTGLKTKLGTYEDGYELQNVEGHKRYRARASLELLIMLSHLHLHPVVVPLRLLLRHTLLLRQLLMLTLLGQL